jgi:hypothetical protein
MMGCDITVLRGVGVGSTFTVTLLVRCVEVETAQ